MLKLATRHMLGASRQKHHFKHCHGNIAVNSMWQSWHAIAQAIMLKQLPIVDGFELSCYTTLYSIGSMSPRSEIIVPLLV